ncbi:PH domain-containing protein [Kitasatospora sp. NBC_00240]|uniref:PH domain-containing protein n=1 Tax=Kitasatospora sp. NBC_00240 TaxID=2903567 RepID=UPI00224F5F09|nr:PH domain-containing protein [Kitasatospora sp. NBC_00240]MCX5213162.1 PH domain-containing protein [Kitasatospora sp. NBC_00240]
MTGEPPTAGPPPTTDTPPTPWRRPHPRGLLLHFGWLAPPLGTLALTALATGGRIGPRAWITLAVAAACFAAVTALGAIGWARTRYRVNGDTFELRTGVLIRQVRTVPLNRIRTVDLTATALHRLLRITALRAGTAASRGTGAELRLDGMGTAEAHRLRTALLVRSGARPSNEGEREGERESGAQGQDPLLVRLDPRWVRYAPLTFWTFGGVLVAAGTAYRILDAAGIEAWRLGFVQRAFTGFGASALWLTVPAALLAVLLLGSAGAVALHAENHWRFQVERVAPGGLRVTRGLLTRRSVTVEQGRLHGVVLREPLLLRAAGGASLRAVAGGLGDRDETRRRSLLLPPAPRAVALRVAADVLESCQRASVEAQLTSHPRVALRRRVSRGLLLVVLPVTVVLALLGVLLSTVLLHCAWVFALVAVPVVGLLARDAYRGLGHGLRGPHLLVRSGTFSRDTLTLDRTAVEAWTFTSSPFGRRAGLVTLTAAVAAGEHGYRIPDLAAAEAPAFAAAATPGFLEEFLDHGQEPSGTGP